MLKRILQTTVITLFVVLVASTSHAFQVRINGVNVTKDFSVTQVILGTLASHATHELGHYAMAKNFDADPTLHFDKVNYDKRMSRSERRWFYRGGYLAQFAVGLALTAIPSTRGTDFTTAYTGYSAANQLTYAATDGLQSSCLSDTEGITENGGNGRIEFVSFGTASAYLTYLNLREQKP